eukprot:RCo022394
MGEGQPQFGRVDQGTGDGAFAVYVWICVSLEGTGGQRRSSYYSLSALRRDLRNRSNRGANPGTGAASTVAGIPNGGGEGGTLTVDHRVGALPSLQLSTGAIGIGLRRNISSKALCCSSSAMRSSGWAEQKASLGGVMRSGGRSPEFARHRLNTGSGVDSGMVGLLGPGSCPAEDMLLLRRKRRGGEAWPSFLEKSPPPPSPCLPLNRRVGSQPTRRLEGAGLGAVGSTLHPSGGATAIMSGGKKT